MFTPLGLFKDIPCPEGQRCSLLTCIFSHEYAPSPSIDVSNAQDTTERPKETTDEGPPLKKPRLDTSPKVTAQKTQSPSKPSKAVTKPASAPNVGAASKPQQISQSTTKIQSMSREVSPPPLKKDALAKTKSQASSKSDARLPPRRAPRESLNPRMLPKAPVSHGVRLSILTKLHVAMCAQNEKLKKEGATENPLVLSPNELVTMALDEEEKAAKQNPGIYANVIKLRIVKLPKLGLEDWKKEVKAHLNERYYKIEPSQQSQQIAPPKILDTGLSAKEEIALLSKLITPVEGLEAHGYVTRVPTKEEVESARKGVTESKGWEKCDRCGGRFQVFPGRREDGSLTTGGQCTYHPGKPFYPPRKQTDHITGPREAYFPCCNESIGTSSGCTKGSTHVFKVSEFKRLASILQFEETPVQPEKGTQHPVCFDCEMGYTTMGLELIRLTAVSWPEGKELLDILVRPMGEVLDLNSRFSGVFPEHYTKAIPYGSTTTPVLEDGEVEAKPLQVVESPAAARALLFKLLQPDTPLIGHAIDNDLNACRIIHPTIIDTVLLYPHPRGLPIRMSLKALVKKHLDRDIQTKGNQGHDSKEDAVATGDLVRVKASETWKILKSKGWQIRDSKLAPPPGTRDVAEDRRLGPGAGHKRKDGALT
ncbi:putative RNA exonuclease Rex3 [Aspergillus clavatus NRRL 1]|uniref:RNA exonuclease 3 n=1 Tax=Aspergillus clavatus (strain ATCC 1007 / CBS 513.65 / DSM 816 / NCTC 3887 / NRRL 1 / QM 1276 / 107) TaxID=344612 RepID=A1CKX8_ASPCL|nr:RNA exonuclease Rex3, putative [Aspergillus clavatus NRRL 1]EAW09802.1 RNA exonuclease Rex3, putative [Aspergillus clavatus NRRL 1]